MNNCCANLKASEICMCFKSLDFNETDSELLSVALGQRRFHWETTGLKMFRQFQPSFQSKAELNATC